MIPLSDEQFAALENALRSGFSKADLAGSGLFSEGEISQLDKSNGNSSGNSKGKGNQGGGFNEWNAIGKLMPLIRRGDPNSSSQTGGLPYQAPQSLAGGGGPSLLFIGLLAALGVGAFLILRHKHKGKGK